MAGLQDLPSERVYTHEHDRGHGYIPVTSTLTTATLAQDMGMALDPVRMARAAGIVPDEWQERMLRSTANRLLINASRQSGKSLMSTLLVAHQSLFTPGSLCLMVAPSERQSGEGFRRVKAILRDLGEVPASESVLRCELRNGSRVVSLPGREQTVRGFSAPSLIVADEASRIPDDLWVALRPMMAVSQGRLVAASTPYGCRGWWFEAWRSTENWERFRIPASEVPRISSEFLEEERRTLRHWEMAQEYECSFEASSGSVFDLSDVEACFDDSVKSFGLLGKAWQ